MGFQNWATGVDLRFRHAFIFDQSAEDWSALDPVASWLGNKYLRAWWMQSQCPMRTPRVVVRSVGRERSAEVSLAEDQHAVGEFGADGQHEAFGEAVRPWAAWSWLQHVGAENPVVSCDLHILVYEAAEPVSS